MSNQPDVPQPPAPDERTLAAHLFDLIRGYIGSELLFVAAQLQLPDHIAEGVRTSSALAERTDSDAAALERVLRGLAHLGVLSHDADGGFSLTPLGQLLTADHPLGYQNVAIVHRHIFRPSMSDLLYSTQTGNVGIERALGAPLFEYLSRHDALGARFDQLMTTISSSTAHALLDAYDFSWADSVADIGGGRGTLLAAILQRYPSMHGVLFELPHVTARAQEYLEAHGVAERATVVAGDFFISAPGGSDIYLLSQILHDWDDVTCRLILNGIRAAMPPHARLLVLEQLLPERVVGPTSVIPTDLLMLAVTGGQERTAAEYYRLLSESGFSSQRIIALDSDFSAIEAW